MHSLSVIHCPGCERDRSRMKQKGKERGKEKGKEERERERRCTSRIIQITASEMIILDDRALADLA